MQSLPLIASTVVAALVGGPLVRSLRGHALVRENYRGAAVPLPIGVVIPVAALVALIPLALLQELADVDVFRAAAYPAVTYVVGVALLGLLDDFVGSGAFASRAGHVRVEARNPGDAGPPPRGWRGHARAIL